MLNFYNLELVVQPACMVNRPIRFGANDVSTNLIGPCDLDRVPDHYHWPALGEALFPGLDLDSGLDWTLDWTLEKMYFWCHCSAKEASGPLPCPLEAQTLNHVHVSW